MIPDKKLKIKNKIILHMHKSYNYEVAVKFLISPSLVSGRAYERIKTFMNSELISQLSEGNLPKQKIDNNTIY